MAEGASNIASSSGVANASKRASIQYSSVACASDSCRTVRGMLLTFRASCSWRVRLLHGLLCAESAFVAFPASQASAPVRFADCGSAVAGRCPTHEDSAKHRGMHATEASQRTSAPLTGTPRKCGHTLLSSLWPKLGFTMVKSIS